MAGRRRACRDRSAPTIRALLAARIDALAADERRIVEAAAVVGKVFGQRAVAALAPVELQPRVGALLSEALRRDLVVVDRSAVGGGDGFRFRHILIRDAVYDAIPKADRATMHERFAMWLADAYVGRTAEVEEILGYHLQEAYRNRVALGPADEGARILAERAASHLQSAGRRALDRMDFHGAVNLLGRAHDLAEAFEATVKSEESGAADDVVTQAYWRAERAKVLARWGRDREAVALAREAVRLIDESDGVVEQADVYVALGEVHRVAGRKRATPWTRRCDGTRGRAPTSSPRLTRARLARIDG